MKLTDKETRVLSLLRLGPLYTVSLANRSGEGRDTTGHRLRRLEDKELVRRVGSLVPRQIKWELTKKGHDTLDGSRTF